jgi:iron complex outermembrane receptor protein
MDTADICQFKEAISVTKNSLLRMMLFSGLLIYATSARAQTNADISPAAGLKQMSLEQLMDLDVTSVAKQPEPYGQAPAAIEVITGDEIRRSGASSIPEALRLADNLDVAQVTASSWDISARGFNSSVGDKLLVLMDGRSVYTPLFSGVIWNMQDYLLEDIDRIEVISGPGGTLWGANAVNGVINITSKSAQDTQGLYVESGGGTELQDFVGVRYGGALTSNIFYRVYAKYFDAGSEVYSNGASAHDSWNRGQGGFRMDDVVSAEDLLTWQGDFYDGDTHTTPGGQGTPSAVGNTSGGNLLSRWTHTYTDESDMHLQIYYDRADLGAPFQSSGAIPAGTLYSDLTTCDVDFQDRFPLFTWNRVVWGLGYRFTHDLVQNAPIVAFLPTTQDQNLFSGFVQDEVKLRENLFFTLGTKIEHNDYTGFEIEPDVRLQWNITDKQMLWGAISRAVRTPSRYDRDLYEPNPVYGTFVAGNSEFESETVIAYELGYRAQLSRQVSTSISTFYNDYNDLRSLGLTGGTNLPAIFQNNDEGYTYGVELSADYQVLDWWRLHGGYDFLKEDIYVKPGRVDLFHALDETADPENQVFMRSAMDLPYRTEFDVAFRWIDSVRTDNGAVPGTVPSYAEINARLAWHPIKTLEVSIVGQNLLHQQHVEAGFPGSTQEAIERSVYGKVAWQF